MVCSSALLPLLQQQQDDPVPPLLQPVELVRQTSITGLTGVGEHHCALIVSPVKQQETLRVYDTRYATLQAHTTLPVDSKNKKVGLISRISLRNPSLLPSLLVPAAILLYWAPSVLCQCLPRGLYCVAQEDFPGICPWQEEGNSSTADLSPWATGREA